MQRSFKGRPVKVPRVRDRGDQVEKVRFTPSILPPYPLTGRVFPQEMSREGAQGQIGRGVRH